MAAPTCSNCQYWDQKVSEYDWGLCVAVGEEDASAVITGMGAPLAAYITKSSHYCSMHKREPEDEKGEEDA